MNDMRGFEIRMTLMVGRIASLVNGGYGDEGNEVAKERAYALGYDDYTKGIVAVPVWFKEEVLLIDAWDKGQLEACGDAAVEASEEHDRGFSVWGLEGRLSIDG